MDVDPPGTPAPSPSLAGRIGRVRLSPRAVRAFTVGCAVIAGILLIGAVTATWQARRITLDTQRLAFDTAAPEAARAEAAAIGRTIAQPTLAATLAALAAKLPSDIQLAEARRGRDGVLRITVDSHDPDEFRARLRTDPWLARFRARSEEQRDDGSLRITLVEGER